MLNKSHIEPHYRTLKSGKRVYIHGYDTKKTRRAGDGSRLWGRAKAAQTRPETRRKKWIMPRYIKIWDKLQQARIKGGKMPPGFVKTERDEKLWNEAKAAVKKQYPSIEEGSDRFYKIVNGIYQKMKGGKVEKCMKKKAFIPRFLNLIKTTAVPKRGFGEREKQYFESGGGYSTEKQRKDVDEDRFLDEKNRKYPFKTPESGEPNKKMLMAAYKRAKQYGEEEIAVKAATKLRHHFGYIVGKDKDEDKSMDGHDPRYMRKEDGAADFGNADMLRSVIVRGSDMVKGKELPIGTVSTYKDGSKWKKVGKDKWVPAGGKQAPKKDYKISGPSKEGKQEYAKLSAAYAAAVKRYDELDENYKRVEFVSRVSQFDATDEEKQELLISNNIPIEELENARSKYLQLQKERHDAKVIADKAGQSLNEWANQINPRPRPEAGGQKKG